MTILYLKNESRRINTLDEIEIKKVTNSWYIILDDNPLYRIVETVEAQMTSNMCIC